MGQLQSTYRMIHQQGFLPIFVEDDFDSKQLVEACVLAGCKGIEYTLRRRDAHIMIPWIREHYPDLRLLVGSTLEGNAIVEYARLKYPQLMTLDELASIGVDGFVSMVGFGPETIMQYASEHLVVAPVSTMYEAHRAIEAGAHFSKVVGPKLDLVRYLRAEPAFDFCPIMVTGGMTVERIPEAVEAGAVLIGSGFDLILKGAPRDISVSEAAEAIRRYLEVTCQARDQKWPMLAQTHDSDFSSWSSALPHHHPFNNPII
jgi:2-keto-3-deoxy-6-phosphogluconate aldolase